MALATIDVQIPKGTWVDLYAGAGIAVGTKVSVFNKGIYSCTVMSGASQPSSTSSGLPLFSGTADSARDVMSDVGLWAYSPDGNTYICVSTAIAATTSGSGGGDASAANQVSGNSTLTAIQNKLPTLSSGNVPTTITTALPAGSNALGTVSVTSIPSIPAGANAIGSVSVSSLPNVVVSTLPSLPTGSNTIGNVGVTSLPALPTGTNSIGNVGVTSLPALPAGSNAIGSVTVTSLPAIPAGSNSIGTVVLGAGAAAIGSVSVSSLPSIPAGTNTIGGFTLRVGSTSSGSTLVKIEAAASTNAVSLKTSAGNVVGWQFTNRSAAERTVKLYNKASAPTVGTDATILKWTLPAGSIMNNPVTPGIFCSTGIAIAITTGYLDTDTTATAVGDVVGHILYA